MKIHWYKTKIYEITERCCTDFPILGNYLNYQPDGIYLEVPCDIEGLLIDDIRVVYKRICKLNYCPFCGNKIEITQEE